MGAAQEDGPEKRVRGDAEPGSELSGLLSAFELRFLNAGFLNAGFLNAGFLNAGFRSKASAAH
jgi:hypothetical protein